MSTSKSINRIFGSRDLFEAGNDWNEQVDIGISLKVLMLVADAGMCFIVQPVVARIKRENICSNFVVVWTISTVGGIVLCNYKGIYFMKNICILITGSLFTVSLLGCNNTLNAVGDTAKGAGKGAVEIIQGVGEGVNHIGKGVKADITSDDGEDKKEN